MIKARLDLLQMDVRCDPAAPAAVRGSMSSLRGLGWALGDAMLVASELVTSVIAHAGCERNHWIRVQVSREREAIVVSVSDSGSSGRERAVRAGASLETDELGMMVVDRLARRWGSERDDGYRVWAEVPLADSL